MDMESILETLVIKASQQYEHEPDYMTMIQITDHLEKNPDDFSRIILNAILKRIRTENSTVQIHSLEIVDFCIKSNNSDFFKTVLQQDYVDRIILLCSKNSSVKQRLGEFLKDWRGSGLKVNVQPEQSSQTQQVSRPSVQSQPQVQQTTTKVSNSVEKLNNDLTFVKETIKLMQDLISSSSGSKDLMQEEFIQVYANLVEMRTRTGKIIESLPEEGILLKLLGINDELHEIIKFYEEYKRSGKKPNIVEKQIFTEEKKKSQMDDLFSGLTKTSDLIDREFTNMATRGETKKMEEKPKPMIDINALFDNSPVVPQKANFDVDPFQMPQPSAPKQEDDTMDLFGSIATRNQPKKQPSNYDEFQNFLKNQPETKKSNNPFE